MQKPLNFLSETACWETISEFTTPDGVISKGKGESLVELSDTGIINKSWALINEKKIENNYVIHKVTENRYEYTSLNPAFRRSCVYCNLPVAFGGFGRKVYLWH